jgi:NAD(P)H dehydrogenase (quinone)
MIIVTGATGKLGRQIVERLVKRVAADQVGVSVRDPAKAEALQALGVRVRRAAFEDPASLRQAFDGARQVLLVSSNAAAHGGDPLAQHRNAIDAARAAGVNRILYTSHMAASASSEFSPARDHAATEEMLRQSGLAWTALRHGFHAENGLQMIAEGLQQGLIEAPQDGKVAWTDHADLAEADAIIAASDGHFDGPTPPLTGSEALDMTEIAAIAARVLGRAIERKTISDDELRAKLTARGAPAGVAEIALGFYVAARTGEFAHTDPSLEQLTGRRAIRLEDMLARQTVR